MKLRHSKDTLKYNIKIMKKILLICLALFLYSNSASAQQDEQMSIYMFNPLYFNPAYAGSKDAISAVAVGRFQWVSYPGAPKSQWFSIHAPLKFKSIGLGGHMVNDNIGRRTRTSAFVDLSGSIQLNKKNNSRLAAGISAGIDVMGYDFSDMVVNDKTDPYYGQQVSFTKPNVGAGLFYYGDKHYIGISSPRVLEERVTTSSQLINTLNTRHFFISGGYVFDLNSVFKLKPSTLIKYTSGAPFTADVNLSLLSYEKLWTGIMYRYNEAAGVNVAFTFKESLTVGYVYDFPINGLMTYQSGSHEIFIQFDFLTKKSVYSSPRYF